MTASAVIAIPRSCKLVILLFIASLLLLVAAGAARAASWDDLDEGETKIFGSEKEQKLRDIFFIQREKWENHRSFMFFWFFKTTDYPRYTSLRILPFWYHLTSKIDNRRRSVVPILFLYHHIAGEERLLVSPLYYSSLSPAERDRSLLYLLWWGGRQRAEDIKSSYFLLPPFYVSTERGEKRKKRVFFSPLIYVSHRSFLYGDNERTDTLHYSFIHFYKSTTSSTPASTERSWWMPIIPLTYHHTSPWGGHRNILWFIDYSWKRGEQGNRLKRLWIFPLWLWGPGRDGYTHLAFPVFMSIYAPSGKYYLHLLPLFITWKGVRSEYLDAEKKYASTYTRRLITPLFGASSTKAGEARWEGDSLRSSLWFPILPVFFASRDSRTGTHRNLLWIIDWASGADGALERFWLLPCFYYKAGESGYLRIFPFYMRTNSPKPQEGVSYGMFHYHRWSPEEEKKWAYLIHYYRSAPGNKEYVNTWFPVYFHWEHQERKGTLFLPLYLNYRDGSKELHVNILGISRSILSGPNPNVSFGIGAHETGWYIDTDISWLYDAASIATRITIRKPRREDETNAVGPDFIPDERDGKDRPQTGVALTERKTVDRESSEYFWGFKLLYGLLAFERADSRRHFRLLPLSWLTWDTASRDQVLWIINYISYASGETEYLVFFPFYGKQRVGKSFKRGYLLNCYWDEYMAQEDMRERTVLWPLVNWYSSPKRSGWRFFPLVWHSRRTGDDVETRRTISPLFYHGRRERPGDPRLAHVFSISPFHVYKSDTAFEKRKSVWFFPIVPLVYGSKENIASSRTMSRVTREGDVKPDEDRVTGSVIKKSVSFVIPLYYRSTVIRNEFGEFTRRDFRESRFWFPIIPLFYRSATEDRVHINLFWFFDWMKHRGENRTRLLMLPLLAHWSKPDERSTYVFPLFIFHKDKDSRSAFGLNIWSSSNATLQSKSFHIAPLYFSWRSPGESSYIILGLYLHSSEYYSHQNFLFLADHRHHQLNGQTSLYFLMGTIEFKMAPELRRFRLFYGALMNYRSNPRLADDYSFSILWHLYHNESQYGSYRHYMTPLWYYWSDAEKWKIVLPPLLSGARSYINGERFQMIMLGGLWYRNYRPAEGRDRMMLLLGIPFYRTQKPERGYSSTGSLWGLLWESQHETETNFSKFSILKFLYKRVEMNGEVYHQVLGIRF